MALHFCYFWNGSSVSSSRFPVSPSRSSQSYPDDHLIGCPVDHLLMIVLELMSWKLSGDLTIRSKNFFKQFQKSELNLVRNSIDSLIYLKNKLLPLFGKDNCSVVYVHLSNFWWLTKFNIDKKIDLFIKFSENNFASHLWFEGSTCTMQK